MLLIINTNENAADTDQLKARWVSVLAQSSCARASKFNQVEYCNWSVLFTCGHAQDRQSVIISSKIAMLELTDGSSLGPNSRPRTPPTLPSRGTPTPPPSASLSRITSPSRPVYPTTLSYSANSWNQEEDDDEDDDNSDLVYDDDDEDEFGLPSIASMRRKQATKSHNLKGSGLAGYSEPKSLPDLSLGIAVKGARSNSFDIAEERNSLSYPSAKKAEGKILRPQYKEILRGNFHAY